MRIIRLFPESFFAGGGGKFAKFGQGVANSTIEPAIPHLPKKPPPKPIELLISGK
jgi:hypothetical protein